MKKRVLLPLTCYELQFDDRKVEFEVALTEASTPFKRDCTTVFPALNPNTDHLFVLSSFQKADTQLVDWSSDAALAKDVLLESVSCVDSSIVLSSFAVHGVRQTA